jgi:hypothetical protein
LSTCGEVIFLIARPHGVATRTEIENTTPIELNIRKRMAMVTDSHLFYVNRRGANGKASIYRLRKRVTDARRYYSIAEVKKITKSLNSSISNVTSSTSSSSSTITTVPQKSSSGATNVFSSVYANPSLCSCMEQVDGLLKEYFPTSVQFEGRSEYHSLERKVKRKEFINTMILVPKAGLRNVTDGRFNYSDRWPGISKKNNNISTTNANSLLQELIQQTGLPLMVDTNQKNEKGNNNDEKVELRSDVIKRRKKLSSMLKIISKIVVEIGLRMLSNMVC